MISVKSRDERKGLNSRYDFEGEKMRLETGIEEGEAYFQNKKDGDDDLTMDPDVSLSYIDEKLQNVLGHCQKDFEGGVSAENLGAKFGGYGSFLPTYQRSPVWPNANTNTRLKDHDDSAPVFSNNANIKAGNLNSGSQSNASQVKNGPASFSDHSGPARRKSNSKPNSKPKKEVNTSRGNKSRLVTDVGDSSDPKSLKVRIKMGSDNMLTKGKAEIYSGLGLDGSPSCSLEASPVNSDGFFHGPERVPDESPTSILEMMTSFPVSGSLLLSPLPYDVLHLTEKRSEDNSGGPVHKGSQDSTVTAVHGSNLVKVDQDVIAEKKSTEKNSVSVESTNSVLPKKETSVDNFAPENKTSSSGGKRKAEGGLKNESFTSKTKKIVNGSKSYTEDFKKSSGIVKDTYKDLFGELDLEQEDNEEMGLEKPQEGINVKTTPENNALLKERLQGKKSQRLSSSTISNGLASDPAVSTVVPVVNEDWVCCDKCEKWRLLPPGVNPGSLPEKWLCSMLDWLPGMNRCSISEDETTKAITSHFHGPVQGSQPVHPVGPHLAAIDGTHQHPESQLSSSGIKKKLASKDLPNEAKRDGPSMSSNSSKKKLHASYKTRSLNGVNRSPIVNKAVFQDSGQSRDVNVEDKLNRKENRELSENFAVEGSNIHHSKSRSSNKRERAQDFPKVSKKVKTDGDNGLSHMTRIDKRDIAKKRKKINDIDGSGKLVKEASDIIDMKEKKATVLKSLDEGTSATKVATKVKNIKDVKLTDSSRKNTVRTATSSSSKVSGSHKTKPNNQESKGSPVESVSSSPMRILNNGGVDPLTKNADTRPDKEKSKGVRSKSKDLPVNKSVGTNTVSIQDSKKPSKKDVSMKEKSNPLPPMGQGEAERKENAGNNTSLKALKHNKPQNLKGNQHSDVKNHTAEKHKDKSLDPTAVLVRDLSNQATTTALREATNLKHTADRVKNAGSSLESRALYIEAALKFLHVASLFESCHSQTGRHGDMIQSKSIYSSTAKLCEYCAHEYERTKEMTTASLAYKCMEVAYMKVIYSSHGTARKDVTELQTDFNIVPTGESPSSSASASDLDNLNNLAAADKAALVKGANQVAGMHVIAAKNKPSFTRILTFVQEATLAMEASRKSRIAFAACSSKEEAVVSAIKRALDFNFHDVEELLHRVRVAMDLINR